MGTPDPTADRRAAAMTGGSSGLRLVRPQRVEHVDGWAVESAGREAVAYEDGDRRAEVGIERGRPSSRLYVDTLEWVNERGERTPVLEPECSAVLARIVSGWAALSTSRLELFSSLHREHDPSTPGWWWA